MNFSQMRGSRKALVVSAVALSVLSSAAALFSVAKKVSPISWGWFGAVNTTSGVAIRGYDPVSYTEGTPALGLDTHRATWRGSEWRFQSDENRARFEREPERFAPRFGGFCTFAVSKGFTADSDPTVWHAEEGSLFLFDSESVKADWLAGKPETLRESEASWTLR